MNATTIKANTAAACETVVTASVNLSSSTPVLPPTLTLTPTLQRIRFLIYCFLNNIVKEKLKSGEGIADHGQGLNHSIIACEIGTTTIKTYKFDAMLGDRLYSISEVPKAFETANFVVVLKLSSSKMIRFILLQNRQGKTRLAKYYIPLEESEKHKVEYEVHRLVVNRDPKFTNFVEFRTHKVIYRRYAGLFFSLCVDITDNELAYLESIHLFVEILDHFFSNVCELDLVFNFHKVYLILDEFILAGELQETSKKAIIERMGELEKQE
ncbi:hypothetical protein CASFOL_012911 [Castilleja foliolosa]